MTRPPAGRNENVARQFEVSNNITNGRPNGTQLIRTHVLRCGARICRARGVNFRTDCDNCLSVLRVLTVLIRQLYTYAAGG